MIRRIWAALAACAFLAAGLHADNTGDVLEIDGLKAKVPATWKTQKITSNMRAAHYVLPKEAGDKYDAEMIVFFFGEGGGGGVKANIDRWKGMITPADGKAIDDVSSVTEMKVGNVPVTVLDARGSYVHKSRPFDPNDQGEKRADYRLIGVVIESPKGPYFVRLVGPAKTIEANKKGFDEWLKNLK